MLRAQSKKKRKRQEGSCQEKRKVKEHTAPGLPMWSPTIRCSDGKREQAIQYDVNAGGPIYSLGPLWMESTMGVRRRPPTSDRSDGVSLSFPSSAAAARRIHPQFSGRRIVQFVEYDFLRWKCLSGPASCASPPKVYLQQDTYVDGTRRLAISPLIDAYLVPEAP
eukprot:5720319-Prymnesium_polylepis.1